jgi:hypothetical protein
MAPNITGVQNLFPAAGVLECPTKYCGIPVPGTHQGGAVEDAESKGRRGRKAVFSVRMLAIAAILLPAIYGQSPNRPPEKTGSRVAPEVSCNLEQLPVPAVSPQPRGLQPRRAGLVGTRFSHRTIKAGHETALPPELRTELLQLPAISDRLNLSPTTAAIGFRVEWDTRDDLFYPRRGLRMDARLDFFGTYVGSELTFQNHVFKMNKYLPVRKANVIALRAIGRGFAGDRIPFYELCPFGMMGELRGYEAGRYRDRAMFATQGEWRVVLPWRFACIGEVAPDGSSFTFEDLLPSDGGGLRFNLSKQRRINLRVDLAYSRTRASWSMGVA